MNKKTRLALALCLAFALPLAACGNDTPAAEPAATVTPAVEAGERPASSSDLTQEELQAMIEAALAKAEAEEAAAAAIASTPAAEDFAEGFFRAVSAVERGAAGSSLQAAKAAYQVLDFAVGHDLANCDIRTLRDNMLAAWESLSDDERAAFDGSFYDGVQPLLDTAVSDGDYASVEARFEDAGVGDEMRALVETEGAAEDWDTLRAHFYTMGNSES